MVEFVGQLFDTHGFPPRWNCGRWTETHGWLHIISDIFVFGAYTAIPCVLAYFVLKRRDIVFPRIFWLFVIFIFACGTTHLIEAIIFWQPIYRFAGCMKLVTALVSWTTVFGLVRIAPQAMALPGLAVINQRLEQEVAERRIAQRRFEEANAALALRNNELHQFLYTVSHDLKSPLVTCRGFIGMLQEDLASRRHEDLPFYIQRLDAATGRMQDLIQDLLQLSRAVNARYELATVDVGQLLASLKADWVKHGMVRDVMIEGELPPVVADRVRLIEVFDNLLTNAMKYGCPNRDSSVTVRGSQSADEVRYFVCDHGPGIPPEFSEKVFLPFERLQSESEGTGIGLAIVRRIVENHGGDIHVEQTPGGGATFAITLPRHGRPHKSDSLVAHKQV